MKPNKAMEGMRLLVTATAFAVPAPSNRIPHLRRWAEQTMKTSHPALSVLFLVFVCSCIATPLPTDTDARREEIRKRIAETPRPKGYVFQPERIYENDFTTLLMKNEVVYGAADSLANLTGKEVFVSYKIQHYTVPDIDAKGSRAMVALELIRSIESIEGANIVVVELGGSTLAIIQRSPDPVKRP